MSDELPEVIVDGQKVAPGSQETLADIYAIVNMANIARLRRLEDSKVPTGTVSIPEDLTTTPTKIVFPAPCISFNLQNDGPGSIYFVVNTEENLATQAPVAPGEPCSIDFHYPTISFVYLKSDSTSKIRIYTKLGKALTSK